MVRLFCRASAAGGAIFPTDHGKQAGLLHNQYNQDCQDVILTSTSNTLTVLGLADGQSSKALSAVGGQSVLDCVSKYIEKTGIEIMASYRYTDELAYDIMKTIREHLQETADANHVEIEQLSSTLVIMAIDQQTGKYITIHLGDGVILGVHEHSLLYISSPDNGITSQYTWLTTSKDALNHLRIEFGNIADYDRVILISDGANELCHGRKIPFRARELLLNGKREEIISYMLHTPHEDDAAIIISDIQSIHLEA